MTQDKEYLKELEQALGCEFTAFFPERIDQEVEKETFQSEIFQVAAFDTMPDKYGIGDRYLYTVRTEDERVTFVVTGKVSSRNPFEVMHASLPDVMDLREDMTVVYQFDGKETITETQLKTGEKNLYSGQNGNPVVLLSYIRHSLGKPVKE